MQIVLGAALITAGCLKGHRLLAFPTPEVDLFTSRWFQVLLVEFELILGTWLVSGMVAAVSRQVAIATFALFTGYSLSQGLAGRETCGCLGLMEVSPWSMVGFDVVSVVALFLGPAPRLPEWVLTRRRLQVVCIAVLGVCCLSAGGYLAQGAIRNHPARLTPDGQLVGTTGAVTIEPSDWTGKRFPLLPFVDIGDEIAIGQWRVILVRRGCRLCEREIAAFEGDSGLVTARAPNTRVALIQVPPYVAAAERAVDVSYGKLTDEWTWVVSVPQEFLLQDGVVIAIR